MKTALRRLLTLFVLLCIGSLLHLRFGRVTASHRLRPVRRIVDEKSHGPANSTLGFGAVLAVSRAGSKRQERLLYAANLTDIDITIPSQPDWTNEDVERIRNKAGGTKISPGSALAWMGHLHALRWFLNTTLETAVIVEDDVDWDIHLRSTQVPAVSAAFRKLVGPASPPPNNPSSYSSSSSDHSSSSLSHIKEHQRHRHHHHHYRSLEVPQNSSTSTDPATIAPRSTNPIEPSDYWGPTSKWELLYLGHCGDYFPAHRLRNNLQHAMVPDATLPPINHMHETTQKFWRDLQLPAQQRLVHRSVWPLCTFAYAVHRRSAERILAEFDREGKDGTPAYDVRILEACRDLGWLCYSVNPELFHHDDGPSEIAQVNSEEDGEESSSEGAPNIACGARSEELYTKDPETLTYLRTRIEEKGECLIDRVEKSMGEWP